MELAAQILLVVVMVATTALVLGLFIWAAVRDGQDESVFRRRHGPPRPRD